MAMGGRGWAGGRSRREEKCQCVQQPQPQPTKGGQLSALDLG